LKPQVDTGLMPNSRVVVNFSWECKTEKQPKLLQKLFYMATWL